jgi:TRAP-type C4-dicarboxylate transport system permease small subunit
MRMKVSLALGPRRPLSRQTAWGCLTTNLAMPGFGSLVAGRVSGYAQAALTIGGMILTMIFGARFIWWCVANWSRFHESEADPTAALSEMWPFLKWPLLGFGMFAVGWLWALATGLQIVSSARKAESATVPPRLK